MNKIDVLLSILNRICPFANVDSSTELIDSKIITSLIVFELVAELETEFNIHIDEGLISWENFVTAEKIVNTILEKVD